MIVDDLSANDWPGHACICSTTCGNESSHRCHMISYHRMVNDYLLLFGSDYNYLPKCDLRLLGPITNRRDDLIPCTVEDQRNRIVKWMCLREAILYDPSDTPVAGLTKIRQAKLKFKTQG